MKPRSKNQIWLSECGTKVIRKKFGRSKDQLNEWERLVYNVWYTDFMLKTVGWIDEERCAHPRFRNEASVIASKMKLTVTADTYRLSIADLNREFGERVEAVCDELRSAKGSAGPRPDPQTPQQPLPDAKSIAEVAPR
jgi:hypothetical protein